MKFKIGDRVLVKTPSWYGECVVIKMGFAEEIMFVRRANGTIPAIYKSWASIIRPKNQQLVFGFMKE